MRARKARSACVRISRLASSASARGSEKVVMRTRASGEARPRWTARCSATMVLPVPAEPVTRVGPVAVRSTSSRCAGWRNTAHFSNGESSAACSSSDIVEHAEAPLRVGVGEGIGIGRGGGGDMVLQIAAGGENRRALRPLRRGGDRNSVSTSASAISRTGCSHSRGTPTSSISSSVSDQKGCTGGAGGGERGVGFCLFRSPLARSRSTSRTICIAPVRSCGTIRRRSAQA